MPRAVGTSVALAAALLLSPAALAPSVAAPSAELAASQTVRMKLKTSWKVTRSGQLKISSGVMSCSIAKLVRKTNRPAKAAVLRCAAPSNAAGTSVRITVSVKGKKGARVTKTVRVTGSTGPGSPGGSGSPGGPGAPGQGPGPNPTAPTISAGQIVRINSDANGNGGNEEAGSPTWSPDGALVAFYSKATNLVPGVDDGCPHVFLKDPASGEIAVVDTASNGALGNGCPSGPGINMGLSFSPAGDWLLFCSASTNLDPGPPLDGTDLFGKNLSNGAVEWFGPGCAWPAWSPDGTKIAYGTKYDFPGCPGQQNNYYYDIYWIDRNSPLTQCSDFHRVSSDSAGNQATWNGPMDSERPMWSPDSSRILFSSSSPSLAPNDTNVAEDLFIKTVSNDQITRISTTGSGGQANGQSTRGAWSPNGARVVFESRASNLTSGDINSWEDIYVKDLSSGAVTLVSTNASGVPALWPQSRPSWSPDGSKITWESEALDLVPGDVNARSDIFTKDLSTGFVQLVSSNASGIAGDSASNLFSVSPRAWSPDGTRLLFASNSSNFAPNDNNGFQQDLYVKTL